MADWFEDDGFWTKMYPYMFSEERLETTQHEVDGIFTLTGFQTGQVLDLCCGPGRHSILFAQKGCQVTGVDRTPFLLKKAREKAEEEGVAVEWVEEDMRRFSRPETYDLTLSMLTSLGYFDDPQEDMLVLKNLYHSLKPGGICVLDMMGREILARNFHDTVSEKHADGSILVQRREILDGWGTLRNERILIENGTALTYSFEQRIYSGQELRESLSRVGFHNITLYGNLKGDPYDHRASRLVAIGWKSK
ncbi:methyltransferase type 11 [candidate division KSB3 bacterium]|uniref:Methyltransferase type 11 n=1 Tax=candidate division KSB3 bacterium TaxID=2044937 RepID=A0A2G6KJG1_9BACT|nr:MAG: methyltransferase type 11 [candidate division KSB3 bacterium]